MASESATATLYFAPKLADKGVGLTMRIIVRNQYDEDCTYEFIPANPTWYSFTPMTSGAVRASEEAILTVTLVKQDFEFDGKHRDALHGDFITLTIVGKMNSAFTKTARLPVEIRKNSTKGKWTSVYPDSLTVVVTGTGLRFEQQAPRKAEGDMRRESDAEPSPRADTPERVRAKGKPAAVTPSTGSSLNNSGSDFPPVTPNGANTGSPLLSEATGAASQAQREIATLHERLRETELRLKQSEDARRMQEEAIKKLETERKALSLENQIHTDQIIQLTAAAVKAKEVTAEMKIHVPEIPIEEILTSAGDRLGEGANGEVLRAMWHGHQVAVKRSFATVPESAYSHLTGEEDDYIRRKVVQECTVLASVRSPYLVAFYGYVCDLQRRPDLIVVEALDKFVNNGSHAPCHVLRDISRGVQHLHHHGVIHRDIKPGNFLYDSRRVIFKLSDLGEAQRFGGRDEVTRTLRGTIAYMPPMVQGEKVTTTVDIFSLGVSIIEIFTRLAPNPTAPNKLDANDNLTLVPEVERRQDHLNLIADHDVKALVIRCLAHRDRPIARECADLFQSKLTLSSAPSTPTAAAAANIINV